MKYHIPFLHVMIKTEYFYYLLYQHTNCSTLTILCK